MKDFFDALLKRFRLLPLLVIVASLAFVVRVGDAALQMKNLSGSAFAEEKAAEKKAASAVPDRPAAVADKAVPPPPPEPPAAETPLKEEKPAAEDKSAPAHPAWLDASEGDIDYSNLRKELYQDLLQRRQQLDEKEKTLSRREALLEAGEKELNRKFQELTGLRNEIQALLKKQSEEENARINSLVKIYEGMKPKDAARIFNTLDMDILMDVVGRMSERKSAPIIAQMDPDRARNLTTMLAEQKKLPDLSEEGDSGLSGNTQ
jgi:flagellar motility protein MotE (MotC chaperone)